MNKIGGLKQFILVSIFVFGVVVIKTPNTVFAAGCTNVSSFGAVTLNIPNLPNDGQVMLWLRMQSPEPETKVFVEVNGQDCYEVNGTNLSDSNWTWHPYQSLKDVKMINFTESSGNNVKVIGVTDGLKIDKVLFTSKDCIPQNFGDNCVTAVEAQKIDTNSVKTIPSPTSEQVSGEIKLSQTPTDFESRLTKLEYVVEGKVVQYSEIPVPFDTTRVANGKHTILIETTLTGGQVIRESTVLDVKNPINPLSPIIRWAKINSSTFKIILISIGSIISLLVIVALIRSWYKSRRQRKFHGF